MRIEELLKDYPQLINRSDKCRKLNCTPEQVIAIINFIDNRNNILRLLPNGRYRKILSAAAFDYAFNLKRLEDEIDDFELEK